MDAKLEGRQEVKASAHGPARLTPEDARRLHAEGLACERETSAMYARMKILSEEEMRLRAR